jgi:hypothetical protein
MKPVARFTEPALVIAIIIAIACAIAIAAGVR